MALPLPPLLGDGQGHYRVHLVGNSGTRKSTTGQVLATILGIPCFSLDTFFWRPEWQQCPQDKFVAEIRAAMAAHPEGWIFDGNYTLQGAGFITDEATDVIWLDPPLILYLPRLILRTVYRLVGTRATCSPGCPETFSEVFSKKGIVWWCVSNHWPERRVELERLARMDIQIGTSVNERKMRRFGGWGGDLKSWLETVSNMFAENKKTT